MALSFISKLPKGDPDFLYVAPSIPACAAFSKESRMRFDNPLSSTGNPGEQQELLDNLNYLNISEIKSLCKRHSIPYRIAFETEDGRRRLTRDDDRKGVVLNRFDISCKRA